MKYKTNINFTSFFKDDETFTNHLKQLETENFDIEEFKKKSLKDQLDWYFAKYLEWEKFYSYNEVNSDLDLENQNYNQNKDIINKIKTKLDELKKVINREILNIDIPLDKYLEKNTDLKEYYMTFYNVLRKKKHSEDSILFAKMLPYISRINSLYSTIMNVEFPSEEIIFRGEPVKLTTSNYNRLMLNASSEEKAVLASTYFESLAKVNKTVSNLLNMRYQIFQDLADDAGYNSILEHTLSDDDLNLAITDNLLKTTNLHLDVLKKYYSLKKQTLGLEKMHFYDSRDSKTEVKMSFDDAIDNVINALTPLGPTYIEHLKALLNTGIMDVYPRENKYLGGYHFRNYTQSLIVMNSHDYQKDSYTMAHELGHAVNASFIKENQKFSNFHFSNFLSEVASLTNEILMANYYLEKASTDTEKEIILEQKIKKFIANVYNSMMWFEFEDNICRAIKTRRPLTADAMLSIYQELYIKYNPEVVVDDYLKYGYITRLHYFLGYYRYYNFQYATGIIMATKIANDIKNNIPGSKEKYLEFLKTGGSLKTLDALKVAGLDLTDDKIIADGFKYFQEDVASYEKLVLQRKNN
ncbi:MAG: M3 family metallopeptidase [Bacilli bacterium]|nr:M3 family metallopeptidase [Bacilli bacterium]